MFKTFKIDVKQWQLERHDDFDTNETLEGWDFNLTSFCDQAHKNLFLGGHCKLSYDEVADIFKKKIEIFVCRFQKPTLIYQHMNQSRSLLTSISLMIGRAKQHI